MTPTPVVPSDGYLTTGEVARRIRGTSQHVRELIKSGRITAIDIAKRGSRPRFRVSEAALADFLAASAVSPRGVA
ncbi:helix-turn-helix domain-containing protein [Streptomyces sp. NPDC047315]|uniref:helix-turn-helix domain-containing protein n=1 Tax=Streptomyces sp. NPDC047315 TaxID=3155142 RepID=UPI0033EE0728